MFQEERERFMFDWSHLGDIAKGRPNMGAMTNVAVYRLMQYTLRDAAIKNTDVQTANRIFFDAGHSAASALYKNLIGTPKGLEDLTVKLQKIFTDLKIGVLRFEKTDLKNMRFTLTVDEDLDCSGLPIMDEAICTYDEGFIAGIFESFAGKKFNVKEVDCWCTGERTCRFEANMAGQ